MSCSPRTTTVSTSPSESSRTMVRAASTRAGRYPVGPTRNVPGGARGDGLRDYRSKRDFGETPDPGASSLSEPAADAPRFVVQEHHATSLHWDLRLEHEGTLASWAV